MSRHVSLPAIGPSNFSFRQVRTQGVGAPQSRTPRPHQLCGRRMCLREKIEGRIHSIGITNGTDQTKRNRGLQAGLPFAVQPMTGARQEQRVACISAPRTRVRQCGPLPNTLSLGHHCICGFLRPTRASALQMSTTAPPPTLEEEIVFESGGGLADIARGTTTAALWAPSGLWRQTLRSGVSQGLDNQRQKELSQQRAPAVDDESERLPRCAVCHKPCTLDEQVSCHLCHESPMHGVCFLRHLKERHRPGEELGDAGGLDDPEAMPIIR